MHWLDCILWVSSLLSDLYSQKPCPWASPSRMTKPESVLLFLHPACSPWWQSYRDIWSGLLSSICAHQCRNPAVRRHSWFLFSWCWSWDPFSVTGCCKRITDTACSAVPSVVNMAISSAYWASRMYLVNISVFDIKRLRSNRSASYLKRTLIL